jgi:uncharacterized protein YdhG (YjbR/CyaY superfamily)
MKGVSVKDVDTYIANSGESARKILEELRKIIKSAVPKADEMILWGYPFYKYHGILAGMTEYKKHVSIQFGSVLPEEEKTSLEKKGYSLGAKRIQISLDGKVPASEIKNILQKQAKSNEAKGK